ncbi:restriction endonuclease subunit S [Synechococcus elongatus IITB7]|uniref:restriction endonuclease subunit S n=1 Tax=Synechococcus elongatus TaxID=32046 RepID=UPI0030D4C924
MSFPKYPAYKESSIAWINSIPEQWSVEPLFSVVDERHEKNIGMKENNLLSLSYGRIVNKDINSNDGLLPESFETYQIIQEDDIVLRLTDLQNDKRSLRSAISYQRGIITSAYLSLKPKSIYPRFISYLLRAYDLSKVFYSMGGGLRQSMKYADVRRLPIVLPSSQEQKLIADFLDRETGKIDALIAEQQRLIELLQEKRQAVISNAVTKGLNPDVPMKDSGIEWLGQVPAHWKICRFKRFSVLQRGHDLTGDERQDGSFPVITSSGPNGYHSEFIATAPGVVTGRYGSTGSVFYIEENYWPHNTTLYIKDFCGNIPRFCWYLLRAVDLQSFSAKSAVPGIDRNDVHAILVAVPPLNEQLEISTYLDHLETSQNSLISEAMNAINLLQERRSALISAAVTGQIDVRGLAEAVA